MLRLAVTGPLALLSSAAVAAAWRGKIIGADEFGCSAT
jgi:hypothetical protein